MLSSGKSIGQVTFQKPLARCNMEELAARQRAIQPTGGVLFARNADGEAKSAARQKVLDIFAQWDQPLHILTMPGLQWRFERKLLAVRDVGWMRRAAPTHGLSYTNVTACENDRAIYYASVSQMPGMHRSTLKRIKPYPFCEFGVKTSFASFFFANVDDLMQHDWDGGWDAAWLDYTGPLTVERLALIARFYERHVRSILIVTALKTRWDRRTMRAVEKAGGYMQWLHRSLPGIVLHELEYFDTSSMAQFAVRKPRWRSPLV